MLGPIITFLAVCAILAIYMSIVHHFLRASEQPEDRRPEEPHDNRSRPANRALPGGGVNAGRTDQPRTRRRTSFRKSCA